MTFVIVIYLTLSFVFLFRFTLQTDFVI